MDAQLEPGNLMEVQLEQEGRVGICECTQLELGRGLYLFNLGVGQSGWKLCPIAKAPLPSSYINKTKLVPKNSDSEQPKSDVSQ